MAMSVCNERRKFLSVCKKTGETVYIFILFAHLVSMTAFSISAHSFEHVLVLYAMRSSVNALNAISRFVRMFVFYLSVILFFHSFASSTEVSVWKIDRNLNQRLQ